MVGPHPPVRPRLAAGVEVAVRPDHVGASVIAISHYGGRYARRNTHRRHGAHHAPLAFITCIPAMFSGARQTQRSASSTQRGCGVPGHPLGNRDACWCATSTGIWGDTTVRHRQPPAPNAAGPEPSPEPPRPSSAGRSECSRLRPGAPSGASQIMADFSDGPVRTVDRRDRVQLRSTCRPSGGK